MLPKHLTRVRVPAIALIFFEISIFIQIDYILYFHFYYGFFIVISSKNNSSIIDIANEYNNLTNNYEFKYILLFYMNYSKIKTLLLYFFEKDNFL